MPVIKVEFKNRPGLYTGIHMEIRNTGSQIRFYEVGKTQHCLSRDTVLWLMQHGSLPRTKVVRLALQGNKSIIN